MFSAMRQARSVPVKHVMAALMLAIKEANINLEDIPVNMHQGQIAKEHPKRVKHPQSWCMREISMKLQHYVYSKRRVETCHRRGSRS